VVVVLCSPVVVMLLLLFLQNCSMCKAASHCGLGCTTLQAAALSAV
jgi:hypothetical protein